MYNLSLQTHNMTSQLFIQVVVLATINVPADEAIVTLSWEGQTTVSASYLTHKTTLHHVHMYMYQAPCPVFLHMLNLLGTGAWEQG